MAHKTTFVVPHRRKREGKTDYRKRLNLLKGRKPRLVIRHTNQHIIAQIIEYFPEGDKVVVQAHSSELKSKGWAVCNANIPEAYLTGMLLAKKAKVKEAIVDLGIATKISGSRMYAVVKGAIDGGLDVHCDEEVFPSEDRVTGKHIASYAQTLAKEDKTKYDKVFSRYIKAKVNPEKIDELVAKVKAAI